MTNLYRADTKKLTQLWDKGGLKDCYCLLFSNLYGFRIVWNDEDGKPHRLENDETTTICYGYFIVLAVYNTEKQVKEHFENFVKWMD